MTDERVREAKAKVNITLGAVLEEWRACGQNETALDVLLGAVRLTTNELAQAEAERQSLAVLAALGYYAPKHKHDALCARILAGEFKEAPHD